jgi:hypothetical protein
VSINNGANPHIYILMHSISVRRRPTMKVNIYNQCSNFQLTYQECFSHGAYWNKKPDWKVDAGRMTSTYLTPFLSTFEGVITYRLKRKGGMSKYIQLFVAWKSEGYKKFRVFVHLTESDKLFFRYTTKLEEYYQRHANQLSTYAGPIKNTWLIPDDTVLMTRLELNFTQRDGVLNIAISEGVKDKHAKKPIWLDPKM